MDFSVHVTDGRLLEILLCALCLCYTCKHLQLTRENTLRIVSEFQLIIYLSSSECSEEDVRRFSLT